jgi:circadian clock protein KaiC
MALERVPTGVERLDEILEGGIPCYSTIFVAGLPGTGKTILSQQALFANGRQGRKGLYLSTISEPPIKVLRFLQGFTFFDPALFGDTVVYGDLGTPLQAGGPEELLRVLESLVREQRPELLVIDSFKALRDTIQDVLTFREFTNDIAIRLAAWEVTALLVGEYSDSDVREGPEFAIADGIIYLYGTEEAEKQRRYLRIMKMRGSSFFPGAHYFDITSNGITVYPRMAPQVVGEYATPGRRVGSAVTGLNEMLGGGLYESTSTMISGSTGSGKTLVAMSFAVESARQGRPALYVSFEEGAGQITRNAGSFGWDMESLQRRGLLDIYHVSPSELNIDRHAYTMKKRADRLGAHMVVIDSITAFQAAVPDPGRYQSYMWAINDYFKRDGVTVILTTEAPGIFGPLEISERNVSFVTDNIIFLRFVEIAGEIKRALGVLKMRGSEHDRRLRELIIEPPRLALGPPLTQLGLMAATTPQVLWQEAAPHPEPERQGMA